MLSIISKDRNGDVLLIITSGAVVFYHQKYVNVLNMNCLCISALYILLTIYIRMSFLSINQINKLSQL